MAVKISEMLDADLPLSGDELLEVSVVTSPGPLTRKVRAQDIADLAPATGSGDVAGPGASADNDIARFSGTTGKLLKAGLTYDNDGTLAANSSTRLPTQAAVKAYVDNASAAQPAIQFKDEGSNIGSPGGVSAVNFTGAGVVASQSGGIVTVDIPGGGGGGSGALPTAVTWNAAIVFDGNKYMPTQIVTSVLAFTVNATGAAEGGAMVVDLIADGVNAPTFTGFSEFDGSAGYVNVFDVRNTIAFWRRDGICYYSVSHRQGYPTEGLQTPPAGVAVRVNTPTGLTESGNGTIGWSYTSLNAGFVNGGSLSQHFQAGVDGDITFTIGHAPGSPRNSVMGLQAASGWSNSIGSIFKGLWVHQDGTIYRVESGVYTGTGVSWSNGDRVQLKRVGADLKIRKYSGGTWTDVYTYVAFGTALWYIWINLSDAGSTCNNLRGTGLA